VVVLLRVREELFSVDYEKRLMLYNWYMAEIQASFIPKKDIKKRRRSGGGFSVNIFLLIAVVIFLTAIFASLGVYLLEQKLIADKNQALETLEKNEENYGLKAIENFILASNRLQAVDVILNDHVNVKKVFELLEQDTLTQVIISNFSFSTTNGNIDISARGSAPSYEHVAVQAKKYGENTDIKDLILSDVDQNREGGVSFNIAFSLDKSFLLLTNL